MLGRKKAENITWKNGEIIARHLTWKDGERKLDTWLEKLGREKLDTCLEKLGRKKLDSWFEKLDPRFECKDGEWKPSHYFNINRGEKSWTEDASINIRRKWGLVAAFIHLKWFRSLSLEFTLITVFILDMASLTTK